MKVKNFIYTKISDTQINVTCDIYKDDGTLLVAIKDRGIISNGKTIAQVKEDIIRQFKVIRDSYLSEKESKLIAAADSLIGKDLDIG